MEKSRGSAFDFLGGSLTEIGRTVTVMVLSRVRREFIAVVKRAACAREECLKGKRGV